MSTRPDLLQIQTSVIVNLRMAMRLVEMTERVLAHDLPWAEEFALRMIRAHYTRRIRGVLAMTPTRLLVASKPTIWPVIGFTLN